MVTYESAVTINRPPHEVFRYLVEPAKQALWSDVPMRPVTPGEMKTGSRIEVTFGKGPLKATLGLEMTNVSPGERMAFKTYSGPIKWEGEYRVEPTEGGSKLSQHGTLEFTGLWRLLAPIVGAEIKSGEIKELERLKAVVEKS
ncbi:MAG: SRPBCC family protein [Chloroflexota bacterium]